MMTNKDIQFRVLQFLNGIKYLNYEHVHGVKCIMCHNLGIEKTEENFQIIDDAIHIYFETQNSFTLS